MKRSEHSKDVWYQLDNAANLFPAITNNKNTNVFRLACELQELVDRDLLQQAVDIAIWDFPEFHVVMRRGLFWHYMERTKLAPQVTVEAGRPCARNFYKSEKALLFSVTCFQRRINLEVFHVLSDGSGAFHLLRAIVYRYLILVHPEDFPHPLPVLDTAPPSHRHEDSFLHHYNPNDKKSPFQERAYTLAGTALPYNTVGVIEVAFSTKALLALAKSKGVTATAYTAALLIYSIHKEMVPKRHIARTIGITIPVDLRAHFMSETARNFFSVADVGYNFSRGPGGFDDVLQAVTQQLKEKLKPEALAGRINYNTGVQKNIFARFAPLFFKNWVLNMAYHKGERATTCAISNLGRITMPEAFAPYIHRFSCLLNPTPLHKLKLCMCSFGDEFVMSFTSSIAETKAQKYFVRHLVEQGLDVRITCNGVYDHEVL